MSRLINRSSSALTSGVMFSICGFIQRGIQLLTIPIFTRLMSTSEYGQYTSLISWYDILFIICTMRLGQEAFNVGYTKYTENSSGYMASLYWLNFLSTSLCTVILLIFRSFIQGRMDIQMYPFYIIILNLYITPAFEFYMAEKRYQYNYLIVSFFTLLIAFLVPVVTVCMLQVNSYYKGENAFVIRIGIPTILSIPFVYKIISKTDWKHISNYWKYSIKLAVPLIPYYLSLTVLNQSDRLMIQHIIGSSEAGLYSLANSAAMILTLLISTINQAFVPWLYRKLKESSLDGIKYTIVNLILVFAIANVVLVVFVPEFITIMAAKEYIETIWLVPILVVSCMLKVVYTFIADFLLFYERTISIAIVSFLSALLNVFLNIIALPRYGYYAAAYTTDIGYAFFTVSIMLAYIWYIKRSGEVNLFPVKEVFTILGIFLLVVSLIINLYSLSNIYRWIIGLMIIVYGLLFVRKNKDKILLGNMKGIK